MSSEGRAPRPAGGDPNEKLLAVTLTPGEWRQLRLWAAEEATSVAAVVRTVLRRELAARPRGTF